MKHKTITLGFCTAVLMTACAPPQYYAPVQDATVKPGSSPLASPYHVVRRGDTLYSIAWEYEIDYRNLVKLNGMQPPYAVHVGQNIRIVPNGQQAMPARGPRREIITTAQSSSPLIGDQAEIAQPRAQPMPLREEQQQPKPMPVSVSKVSKPLNVNQKSGLSWRWPTNGPMIHAYSTANQHKGIDIGGQTGQLIYAASKGTVAYAGSGLRGYGNLIILKHNAEFLSAYAHNSELLVQEGQTVNAGDPIAKMGNTESARTKLHFEIRKAGSTINPLFYLPRKVG